VEEQQQEQAAALEQTRQQRDVLQAPLAASEAERTTQQHRPRGLLAWLSGRE
jgi:hypothetical protein